MQVGVELIPQRYALQRDNGSAVSGYQRFTTINPKFHIAPMLFPHSNTYLHLVNIRVDTQLTDIAYWMCLQSNMTHNTIPVALRLVCDRVRVLTHTHILDAIIHLNADGVLTTISKIRSHIIVMRNRQRHLVPHGLAIHDKGCFNMRTFHEQEDATSLPLLGHRNLTLVITMTHIVAFWCQEEGELHLASLTVSLHIRIKVK